MVSAGAPGAAPRYSGVAQLLHWVSTAVLFLLLPFVWVAENFPEGPVRVFWYLLHESCGISLFLLVVARIAWRLSHPPPPGPAGEGPVLRALAWGTHWGLYLVLLAMPVTGYLMAGNGQPVPFFRLFDLPGLPRNDVLGVIGNRIHVALQFAVYGLVILHILGTAWHVAVRRDGLLDRMLPLQDRAPRG
ncbi:cytochrome b/b6 domain-containing protein [Roseomonas sp. OT10]|uniref:cytochrome b n=1 Tax=Roseomonas cutis TaxID=2897332 RepID=UPI001E64F9A2|nr:cytochrome b/b6 domain-containing protein [Roseomonas sp. OT10]UFN48938.1 cytochrome b/b6 domain-containing protein [Roseomonas sp. OT10]